MRVPRWLTWLTEATAQQLFGAALGSALFTSLVNAVVRRFTIPSWELSWIMWSSSACVWYLALVKTSPLWMRALPPSGAVRGATQELFPPRPTAEILESDRLARQGRRQQLIKDWRAMVITVQQELRTARLKGDSTPEAAFLEAHPDFLTLRPHLSEAARDTVYGNTMWVPPPNSSLSGPLFAVLSDIDNLEKEWKLV